MAFAVVHPDGVVLFDTGIGVGDPGRVGRDAETGRIG